MLKEFINDKVANVFFNLYDRWQEEKMYEDINQYGNVLAKVLTNVGMKVDKFKMTKHPFGLKFTSEKCKHHIFIKNDGEYIQICYKSIVPKKV